MAFGIIASFLGACVVCTFLTLWGVEWNILNFLLMFLTSLGTYSILKLGVRQ